MIEERYFDMIDIIQYILINTYIYVFQAQCKTT